MNPYRRETLKEPIGFYRGKHECYLTSPNYKNGLPCVISSEEFYETMETWEKLLSYKQRRTDGRPEVGFHVLFGDVNPTMVYPFLLAAEGKATDPEAGSPP